MLETRAEKTAYLADMKRERVVFHGCNKCGKGEFEAGFGKYWDEEIYEPRRFVFKYTDKRGSDIPVAKLPRSKNSTLKSIDEALSRCVILCRSCADQRRIRKEVTQCHVPHTMTSPSDS